MDQELLGIDKGIKGPFTSSVITMEICVTIHLESEYIVQDHGSM